MDIITFMGEAVWRRFGSVGFVMFSGLSILPPKPTIGDVIVRVVAALYLRKRSPRFRLWVARVESAHMLTWGLRLAILTVSLSNSGLSHLNISLAVLVTIFVAVLLRAHEKPRTG